MKTRSIGESHHKVRDAIGEIAKKNAPATYGAIEERTGFSKSWVRIVVNRLIRAGLVERGPKRAPGHHPGRSRYFKLTTPSGKKINPPSTVGGRA